MTSVLASLNDALYQALQINENVVLMGEDILSPYGGAFRVTRGLSEEFPERVLNTPISEAALVGLGSGMALRGLRPVVEIMFGDFITLAADQIINHAAKFHWMYNHKVKVPLVIRTPMGGRRGYGPTHSQSLEKLFLGVPGIRILAPTFLGNPGKILLEAIIKNDHPILFIENKLLYNLSIQWEGLLGEFIIQEKDTPKAENSYSPTYVLNIKDAPAAQLTIAAYGYMAELARQSALSLAYEHEIFVDLIVPTQLSPFSSSEIIDSLGRTGKLLVLEEGNLTLGWGAEIIAQAAEKLGDKLINAKRVAALDLPIPASGALEALVLPDKDKILHAALSMV